MDDIATAVYKTVGDVWEQSEIESVKKDCNSHGLTLCSGSLGCTKGNDYISMVKKYCKMVWVYFAHIRSIRI